MDSTRVGDRHLILVGGIAVDSAFLGRLRTDSTLTISLVMPGDTTPTDAVAEIPFPYAANDSLLNARFVIAHPSTDLAALRESVDRWFAAAVALVAIAAAFGAMALAARVSQPLVALAAETERLDLDRLDGNFATRRDDEIGTLSRVLGALVRRLRSSTVRLKEAERRATIGDVSRQVTHDIKNGLAPLRHVLRHFDQVAREDPTALAAVFAERRATLDASVTYLDALAQNYARLAPRSEARRVDVNAIARSIVVPDGITLELALDPAMPEITADPLGVRRIIENLATNSVHAMAAGGTLTIATTSGGRLTIEDTGSGMTQEQLARAFDGPGLGLSIVRRLVTDLAATLTVDTEPGRGTRVTVAFNL